MPQSGGGENKIKPPAEPKRWATNRRPEKAKLGEDGGHGGQIGFSLKVKGFAIKILGSIWLQGSKIWLFLGLIWVRYGFIWVRFGFVFS
jgi:hypothetical protein